MISCKAKLVSLVLLFSSSVFATPKQSDSTHKSTSIFGTATLIKDAPPVPIKMWTSRDGGRKQENIREKVDIGGLYFDGLLAYDIQYERTFQFRGLKLRDLVSQYKPIPPDIDFILLHSNLGMILPVSIKTLREDTEVFIALAIQDESKKTWGTNFPSSVYSQPGQKDQIALSFANNKMVVGKNWRHTDFAITPWRFFDSLEGIEFISTIDYYKALIPAGASTGGAGRSVYMRRCQYCHGVGEFGATYAPNFAQLLPDDQKKSVDMIMKKVLPGDAKSSPKTQQSSSGKMPKQLDFTKSEASDLVRWISAWKKK